MSYNELLEHSWTSSGNMAGCVGILSSVATTYEEMLEELLNERCIKRNESLRSIIERRFQMLKESRAVADYMWEHRTEKTTTYETAREAVREQARVA